MVKAQTISTKKENKKLKIAVGLSGGVDSAVTAMILRDAGHEVTGVHLQCWDSGCSGDRDRADAVEIASTLGIKFQRLDFIEPYKKHVLDYFYDSYSKGLTPNPDILCNTVIKFGLFLDWALEQGFDYVATGHYAKVKELKEGFCLFSGDDLGKDQSYFLYRLNQMQLSKALFPLGGMQKKEVRDLAEKGGLPVFNKPDSTGICFIGDVSIQDFLKKRISPKEGKVVLQDGSVIGKHEGAWFYTIGQRHGFEVTKYVGIPLYVVAKNVEKNELIVGPIKQAFKTTFSVSDLHWICGPPTFPLEVKVRVRNLGEFYDVRVSPLFLDPVFADAVFKDSELKEYEGSLEVISQKEIFGVAPGQSAVFYKDSQVLGGGIIK